MPISFNIANVIKNTQTPHHQNQNFLLLPLVSPDKPINIQPEPTQR